MGATIPMTHAQTASQSCKAASVWFYGAALTSITLLTQQVFRAFPQKAVDNILRANAWSQWQPHDLHVGRPFQCFQHRSVHIQRIALHLSPCQELAFGRVESESSRMELGDKLRKLGLQAGSAAIPYETIIHERDILDAWYRP